MFGRALASASHVSPFSNDAKRALPSLDHVGTKEAGPASVDPFVGVEEFLLAAWLYAEAHNVERCHGFSFHQVTWHRRQRTVQNAQCTAVPHAAGLMFWFTRKRLAGSYFFFTAASRA
jgi:hypothetical protein